jgi:hypothetical protein
MRSGRNYTLVATHEIYDFCRFYQFHHMKNVSTRFLRESPASNVIQMGLSCIKCYTNGNLLHQMLYKWESPASNVIQMGISCIKCYTNGNLLHQMLYKWESPASSVIQMGISCIKCYPNRKENVKKKTADIHIYARQ